MYPVDYLRRADLAEAADRLRVSLDVVKAVAAVEARASGFIRGTDLPCILFEGRKFHAFTEGAFDRSHPHLSHARWTKAHYRGGRGEYDRLVEAIRLAGDPGPALKATSWGMFQIMGFNHRAAGHATVEAMVDAFAAGEGAQLRGFVAFVEAQGLAESLRDRRWADFARRYNGPGYAANAYDAKLAQAFALARRRREEAASGGALDLERGDVMAAQAALNLALGERLAVDGWMGPNTEAALRAFQRREGLAESGAIDAGAAEALGLDVAPAEAA